MKTYRNARHGFDAPGSPHVYAGHYIGQDPTALADSLIETRRPDGLRFLGLEILIGVRPTKCVFATRCLPWIEPSVHFSKPDQ
jgi:hypothetical protein